MKVRERVALELTKALIQSQPNILESNEIAMNDSAEKALELLRVVSDAIERKFEDGFFE